VQYREFWVDGVRVEDPKKSLSCERGGNKTKTPHSSWCPLG
jgi:hypothetical protein